MPKKTRREKLQAEKRRKSSVPSFVSKPGATEIPSAALSTTFQFQASDQKKARLAETENTAELTVITRDLGKTLILACIAIAVEIFIYWLLHGR
jgi:hypothetical protein